MVADGRGTRPMAPRHVSPPGGRLAGGSSHVRGLIASRRGCGGFRDHTRGGGSTTGMNSLKNPCSTSIPIPFQSSSTFQSSSDSIPKPGKRKPSKSPQTSGKTPGKRTKLEQDQSVQHPELPTGGFLKILHRLHDGGICETPGLAVISDGMIAKCEDLDDVGFLLKKLVPDQVHHIGVGEFLYLDAGQDGTAYLTSFLVFKECLSKTNYTNPMVAVVRAPPDQVTHGKKPKEEGVFKRYLKHVPSSMDAHTVRGVQCAPDKPPLFRCERPYCRTLPAPLLHPVFGEFLDNLQKTSLQTADDHTFVQDFCNSSQKFFKLEVDRSAEIFELLERYLETKISVPRVQDGRKIEVDGCISGRTNFPVYAILEVENEIGSTKTLKNFQGMAYYSRFCLEGRKKGDRAYFLSNCPGFLVEIQGPHIRVSAMTFLDSVTSCFLTNIVNVVHSNSEELASIFIALKLGLASLEKFYDGIQGDIVGSKRLKNLDKLVPFPLWLKPKFTEISALEGKTVVFLAEDASQRKVVLKFCKRYGELVHQAWYNSGYAPQLLEFHEVGGGYKLIVMEYLGPPWKPFVVLNDDEKEECRLVVLEALKKLHALPVFGLPNQGSVHGDAREGNIMVMREDGDFRIKFVDFDWAGQAGVSAYPMRMNHMQIAWPHGVADGLPMHQSHDVAVVTHPPDRCWNH